MESSGVITIFQVVINILLAIIIGLSVLYFFLIFKHSSSNKDNYDRANTKNEFEQNFDDDNINEYNSSSDDDPIQHL